MISHPYKGLEATDKMLTIHMYIFVVCVCVRNNFFYMSVSGIEKKKNREGESGGETEGCQLLTNPHLS